MFGDVNISSSRLSNFHKLAAITSVTEYHSHAARMFFISESRPANGVGVVEVIVLIAVGIILARQQKFIDN